jgi:hypothetical protein
VSKPEKLWFRAKRYGWGWTPTSWQGWLVMFTCLGAGLWPLLATASYYSESNICGMQSHIFSCVTTAERTHDFVLASVWLTVWLLVLFVVCYKKGEKPRWRWGS